MVHQDIDNIDAKMKEILSSTTLFQSECGDERKTS